MLLTAPDVRRLADLLGLRPTKQLGQNFVIDPNTVRRIVRTAGVGADDVVVEVGPGLGSLTLGLLPEVARVVAVEIDPVLAAELPRTVAERLPEHADRLEVVNEDALRLTGVPGPAPTAFVANLPYNVAVPVLLRTYTLSFVNGKLSAKHLGSEVQTAAPVTQVVAVGTKPRPAVSRSVGSADGLNWPALARCESGGNPRAVSRNGTYRGLYQFSFSTWRGVGGTGDPIDASPSEQTYRAKILYSRSGRSPWPVCGKYL